MQCKCQVLGMHDAWKLWMRLFPINTLPKPFCLLNVWQKLPGYAPHFWLLIFMSAILIKSVWSQCVPILVIGLLPNTLNYWCPLKGKLVSKDGCKNLYTATDYLKLVKQFKISQRSFFAANSTLLLTIIPPNPSRGLWSIYYRHPSLPQCWHLKGATSHTLWLRF